MVAWGPIESTPYPGEPGGTPADITGDPSGGLDDPSVVLPESAVQLVEPDGTHVAWLVRAHTWGYRRDKSGPGSGSATLNRSDPHAALAVFPRQLRFYDRGVLRARSLIEPRGHSTVSRQEEAGEEVTVGAAGPLALTARGRVDPIRLTLKPKQGGVRFTYAHPDYDDTGWDPVVDAGTYGRPTDWPGGGTNITGPSGDHDFAPGGTYYFRAAAPFTLADDTDVAVVWYADNLGRIRLNGHDIDVLETLDANNYLRTHERRYRLDAGDHFLAGSMFNQSGDVPGPTGNPGFINITVREIDANGQLGDIIASTDTTWLCYEFLQSRPPGTLRPGWTCGEILNWLLDRWEARAGVTIARSFTATLDSDGVTWPLVLDFTATIGSLYDTLQALAEIHCDLDWGLDTDELHAWVKDTRGTVTTVNLPSGYTDPANGCLLELRHDAEPPVCTSALVEWRDEFVIVEDAGAAVPVERKIDAPLVDTAAAAEVIGEAAIATFGVERVRGTASLHPRSDDQRPGDGFDVADTVDAPDRNLTLVPQVIQSYTHTVDRDANIRWSIEFGDQLFDREERFANWLKGITNGHLGGRTFQTTPYREEILPAAEARVRQPLIYDHLATDATGESDPLTVDDYLTIQAVTIDIPGGEGATFDLNVNGVTVDTFVVAAAATQFAERNLTHKLEPGDKLTIESTAAIRYLVTVHVV